MPNSSLRILLSVLVLFAFAPVPSHGQGAPASPPGDDPLPELLNPYVHQERSADWALPISINVDHVTGVSDAFRDLFGRGILRAYTDWPHVDYSFAAFDSLIALRPDRPEGYFGKAAIYFGISRISFEQTVTDSLEYYAAQTERRAEAMKSAGASGPLLDFYIGAINANLGLYDVTQGRYLPAYMNTRKGRSHLQRALKHPSGLSDAALGLGLLHYYTSVLPGPMRVLLFFLRMQGDRDTGLAMLHDAIDHSHISQFEALFFLADIYDEHEGRPDDAAAVLRYLMGRFPGNVMYEYLYALDLCENGNYVEADPFIGRFLARQDLKYPFYRQRMGLYYAQALHHLGEYERSTNRFGAYLDLFENTNADLKERISAKFDFGDWDDLLCECYYAIGLNYEHTGERDQAVAGYRKALKTGSRTHRAEIADLLAAPMPAYGLAVRKIEALLARSRFEEGALGAEAALASIGPESGRRTRLQRSVLNVLLAECMLGRSDYVANWKSPLARTMYCKNGNSALD